MDLHDALQGLHRDLEGRATDPVAGPIAAAARRRRALSRTAFGAVSTAAAAALVIGGLTLADRPAPLPPAVTTPAPTPTSSPSPTAASGTWPSAVTVAAIPACEDPAPVLDAPADPVLSLTMTEPDGSALADQRVNLAPEVVTTEDFWAVIAGDVTYVLVAREGEYAGRVVAVSSVDPGTGSPVGPEPRGNSQLRARTVAFASCVPGLRPHTDESQAPRTDTWLPDGTYDAYVIAPLRAYQGDGTTYGGPDVLLLAGGPATVTLAGLLPMPTAAPDLPSCGQSTAALAATTVGPLSARAWSQRLDDAAWFAPVLDNQGSTAFTDIRWSRAEWVIGRAGVVVAAGALDPPSPQVPATAWGDGSVYLQDSIDLAGLTDCRTGEPLEAGGPVELWTRPVVTLDLTPADPDDADATLSLIAAPAWFTFHPAPVPADAPLLGADAPGIQGVTSGDTDQVGPSAWTVQQGWDDGDAYQRMKASLVASGLTLTTERLQQPQDHPGDFNYVWATFAGSGWTYDLSGGNDTGGGWLATWTLTRG